MKTEGSSTTAEPEEGAAASAFEYGNPPPETPQHREPLGASGFGAPLRGVAGHPQTPGIHPTPPSRGPSPAAGPLPTAALPAGVRPTAPRPLRLAKRPKGRLLIGSVLIGVLGFAGYQMWNTLFRYAAYGVVTGRVIHVAAPWPGTVQSLHVREGDQVRQGQLLATLDNVQLQDRLARLGDDLKIAQANLESEISQSQWQSQLRGDLSKKALAEYYELWGTLLRERATLSDLEANLERSQNLNRRHEGSVPVEQVETLQFSVGGQRAKIEKLESAVEELRNRVALTSAPADEISKQFQPQLVRIETLQEQLHRIRDQIKRGQIRSPVNGRVIAANRFTGEFSDVATPLVDVLEDGTLEIEIYVSQKDATRFKAGDRINVQVVPSARLVECTVAHLGSRLESPPESLARYYHAQEKLIPIHLHPDRDAVDPRVFRLGSEVRLPRLGSKATGARPEE